MAQKKKNKRVNRTPHELMEEQRRKAFLKSLEGMPLSTPGVDIGSQSKPSWGAEKTISAQPRAVVSRSKTAPKDDTLLLTVADLCAELKVSRSTLSRMEKGGTIPGRVMIGGSVRYHRPTIERWLSDSIGNK